MATTTSERERLIAMKRSIHSLVMAAFVGPRPDGHEINHKDGDVANNRLDNLEYVTPAENRRHAETVLGHRERLHTGNATLTREAVLDMRRLRADGWTYAQLCERFGVGKSAAIDVVQRRSWKWVS